MRYYLVHSIGGVTLIRFGGIRDNHALIVIEGEKNKQYFMFVAELLGPSNIRITEYNFFTWPGLKYVSKTKTWVIMAWKAQRIIDSIIEDKQQGKPEKFSYLGSSSVLSKNAHNCMTWAIEKLEIADIVLPKYWSDAIVTRADNYIDGSGNI